VLLQRGRHVLRQLRDQRGRQLLHGRQGCLQVGHQVGHAVLQCAGMRVDGAELCEERRRCCQLLQVEVVHKAGVLRCHDSQRCRC
jgi:hypothetical protein